MMLHILALATCLLGLASPTLAALYPPDVVDKLLTSSMSKLKDYQAKSAAKGNCTIENAAKRIEW
jgi:hypothetical protein